MRQERLSRLLPGKRFSWSCCCSLASAVKVAWRLPAVRDEAPIRPAARTECSTRAVNGWARLVRRFGHAFRPTGDCRGVWQCAAHGTYPSRSVSGTSCVGCGVDRTSVSRAERGERQPARATVFLPAPALGVSPASLIADTEALFKRTSALRQRRARRSSPVLSIPRSHRSACCPPCPATRWAPTAPGPADSCCAWPPHKSSPGSAQRYPGAAYATTGARNPAPARRKSPCRTSCCAGRHESRPRDRVCA